MRIYVDLYPAFILAAAYYFWASRQRRPRPFASNPKPANNPVERQPTASERHAMRRGPNSTPARLKLLYGNPGKRAIRHDEVELPLSTDLEPPDFLPDIARQEWERVAPLLAQAGLLSEADTMPLVCYCLAVDRLRRLTKAFNESEAAGPLAGAVRAAAKDVVKFGAEFGMGPSARRRI